MFPHGTRSVASPRNTMQEQRGNTEVDQGQPGAADALVDGPCRFLDHDAGTLAVGRHRPRADQFARGYDAARL
jgi:hypothetical protein